MKGSFSNFSRRTMRGSEYSKGIYLWAPAERTATESLLVYFWLSSGYKGCYPKGGRILRTRRQRSRARRLPAKHALRRFRARVPQRTRGALRRLGGREGRVLDARYSPRYGDLAG